MVDGHPDAKYLEEAVRDSPELLEREACHSSMVILNRPGKSLKSAEIIKNTCCLEYKRIVS